MYARATRKKVQSRILPVASKADLITMKELAVGDRDLPSDAQDLDWLKGL